ncbi:MULTISPECIES: toxin-antitoxin system HicB family antitoxin [Streptomyces]|uniref:toxin-antitoxin system HicB family antitoxin n=1 Tax=Streptomyces TaxID=1883 RepID=UPI00364C5FE9
MRVVRRHCWRYGSSGDVGRKGSGKINVRLSSELHEKIAWTAGNSSRRRAWTSRATASSARDSPPLRPH